MWVVAKLLCTIGSGLACGAAVAHASRAAACCVCVAVELKCTTISRLFSEALHPASKATSAAHRPSVCRRVIRGSLRVVSEPIESYALLGDMQTAALVSATG